MKKSILGYTMAVMMMAMAFVIESAVAAGNSMNNKLTAGEDLNANKIASDTMDESANFIYSDLVVLPQPINGINLTSLLKDRIVYPASALENYIEGKVRVLCTVESNGLVSSAKIIESTDTRLNEEVISEIKKVAFRPAVQNGHPVKYSMIIPVVFKLMDF
jgi:TonB family protein